MTNRVVDVSGDGRIDALLSGAKWGEGDIGSAVELTYSFPSGKAYWKYNDEVNAGWYGLGTSQRLAYETALQAWADVAQLTFTEVADDVTYGDLRIGYSYAVPDDNSAYAYLPSNGAYLADGTITPDAEAGDIWLHPSLTEFSAGGHGQLTLVHELGHVLGLKHSFESSGGFLELPTLADNTRNTVMSYTDTQAAGYRFTGSGDSQYNALVVKPSTPMLYDILAIQHLYGANMETRSDDTTYVFDTQAELKAIWDGGGVDTFDLSNQQEGVNVNLNAGAYSDIGQRQMTFAGPLERAQDNIAIAFGVEIENAIGTSFDDIMQGNALDNTLTGGEGDDWLYGGDGDDTAVFAGVLANYNLKTDGDVLLVSGVDGEDRLEEIENLTFDDGTVAIADLVISDTDPVAAVPTNQSEVNHTPTEGQTAYFLLELSQTLSEVASVSYTTRDGTAKAGEDYVATSGVLTMLPGQTFVAIAVDLINDGITEADEYFQLAVTNPVGGTFPDGQVELVAQRIIIDNDA